VITLFRLAIMKRNPHIFNPSFLPLPSFHFITNTEGVRCLDGATGNTFTLHAYILSVSGDLPALAKVMCTTGHNSYKACRFCSIQGVYCRENRHVYFPLKPPTSISGNQYDPGNLPVKRHEDYVRDVRVVENTSGSLRNREVQERGKLLGFDYFINILV